MTAFKKCLLLPIFFIVQDVAAQDINTLLVKAKAKLETVRDYSATGKMKTNVAFLKVPVANISVLYKKPGKLKIKSEKGISFIPKGAVSINMADLGNPANFTVIDAGTEAVSSTPCRVAKLLPNNDDNDVVLITIYIDPVTDLIRRSKTTTKENGTYELDMAYGKYAANGLPDKIVFSFNTKDYKLPKGITFDFDDGTNNTPSAKQKNRKGRVEISFNSYVINRGISDALFK